MKIFSRLKKKQKVKGRPESEVIQLKEQGQAETNTLICNMKRLQQVMKTRNIEYTVKNIDSVVKEIV